MARTPCAIVVVTANVNHHSSKVFEAMGAGALDAVNTPVLERPGACGSAQALLAKIETIRKLIGAERARSGPASPSTGRAAVQPASRPPDRHRCLRGRADGPGQSTGPSAGRLSGAHSHRAARGRTIHRRPGELAGRPDRPAGPFGPRRRPRRKAARSCWPARMIPDLCECCAARLYARSPWTAPTVPRLTCSSKARTGSGREM